MVDEMYKYTKVVSRTYFKKSNPVSIEEVKPGDLVYLSVKSPLHYGNYSWEYWGKIQKITPQFFYVIEYCQANFYGPNSWETESIKRMDSNPKYCKRCAKKRIIELNLATTTEKIEEVTYHSNVPPKSE